MLENTLRGKKVILNGYNGAIINATEEDLNDVSALMTWPTATFSVEVASSSVADVLTSGTGAWTLRVHGLDANYAYQTEDFNLNGQTAVSGTKTWRIVFGAEVLTVGTGLVNAGNVQVANSSVTWTGGVASDLTLVYAMVATGKGIAHCSFYQVPDGERYQLSFLSIQNAAQICDYRIAIKLDGQTWIRLELGRLSATANPLVVNLPVPSIVLPEKTAIRIMASAATTGAIGACIAELTRFPVAE